MKIVLICLVLLVPAAAGAQSTRVEVIAAQQADKAKDLGVEGPSNAERVIRRVLLSPLLNGGDGAYPWFGSVFGGSGMAAGAGFMKRLEGGALFNAQTGVSINGSTAVRGSFVAPELWRGMLQVNATGQWLGVNGVSYYGPGQASNKADRERYDFTPLEFSGNVTVKPRRFLFLASSYTFMSFDTARETPVFSETEAPGLDQSLAYHITRGTISYDWRPSAGYSTRGGMYRATFEHNHEANGKAYSFSSQEYEVVQQVPLVREQFVLAFRGLMTLSTPRDGHDVPVVLAPFLGSGSTLRGYSNRRFTDRDRLLLTAEYRWRPSRYLDMAVFYDTGQVAHQRSDFDREAFDSAWGIGARFHGPTFTAFRVEVARGREGLRMIFAGSQPF